MEDEMRRRLTIRLNLLVGLWALGAMGLAAADSPLRGTWRPDTYILKDGSRHPLAGIVTFTDREWTFLVFVMDNGEPRRAEGEGGTYTLKGEDIVFHHEFLLTVGHALGSLPESPLRMQVTDTAGASTTPARVTVEGDRLTVHFGPSGNAMTFERSRR
jgi:hypothetical protein